jgi:hypothetical protein
MDKTNVIVYSSIGLILIGSIIYSVFLFNKTDEPIKSDFNVPDIVLDESKEAYQSRLQKATAYQPSDKEIGLGKDFDFEVYQADSSQVIVPVSTPYQSLESPAEKETGYLASEVVAKPKLIYKSTKNKQTNIANPAVTKSKTTVPDSSPAVQPVPYNNYGVSLSSNNQQQTLASFSSFFEAFLLSDTKVKNGSQLVFILSKDTDIQGVSFRKMSRIFAVAEYSSSNINVVGNVIQNTDGKKYPIKFVGYNENYQEGIFNKSKIDESINQGSNDLVQDAVTIPSSKVAFVSTMLNSAGRATKEVFKKQPEIHISEGYRMYFKSN